MGDRIVGCQQCRGIAQTSPCRPPRLPIAPATPASAETERLLRPQPPAAVPARSHTAQAPGLVAYAVMGGRVVR